MNKENILYSCKICGMLTGEDFCDPCAYKNFHDEHCLFLKEMMCPVEILCDHGKDVCCICTPCTCKRNKK